MSNSTSQLKRRRDGRAASEPSQLGITVLRKDIDIVEMEGKLLDVSTTGVRLSLAKPLAFQEKIVLQMPKPAGEGILEAMAEVRWMKNVEDDDSWTIGCLFFSQLTTDTINEFAIHGVVDRRSTTRESNEQRAVAQWEATEEWLDVTVINSSSYGLCIFASGAGEIGRKTRLKIDQDDGSTLELTATAKWLRQFESGYMIGCEAEESLAGKQQSNALIEGFKAHKRAFSSVTLFCIFLIAAIFYWSNWAI